MRRVLTSRHEYSPGTQSRAMHAPALHVCADEHAVVAYPSPSGLHTRRVAASRQLAVPGVQIQLPQVPVMLEHAVPIGQVRGDS